MNTTVVTHPLLNQIARLRPVPAATLDLMRQEALNTPTPGVISYSDYQSGGWWTASLLNHSGDPHDTIIGDGTPQPTTLLEHMPTTAAFLRELGLRYMYVRLARLEPNGWLWEHRDYAELTDVPRHRLHIPLATNASAVLVTAGARVHMRTGWLWRLTPTVAHGVCNELGPERLHLIADVYVDDAYRALAEHPDLDLDDITELTPLSEQACQQALSQAADLARLGFVRAAEQHLLRLYYRHALPEGGAYDLIAQMHQVLGDEARAERWRRDKTILLARD
ncbi:hypothetical protein GCM10010156_49170 [Planobispora rosea]|uniref:Aspartyl/asparaginy/proline hydroxylase domain-containing protein n=1 Tax=Planobispora rosea TaxID=35762 RepID=A0A8J3SAT6_PLARO|nr:aspartyl/asparaginyl beta-hydroxylase domain-containing protein [Planobispora rosea]GGS84694.1 hypothetical protein GCM10010156_49170 [Planobispora rosea]GIH86428.1 hypothetical protein Pro02_48360 [Planobispora rosea]